MHVVNEYPDGVFCWVDLSTTDIKAAKAFYQALFGWDATDTPIGDSGATYTNFKIGGHTVAGGGELQSDMVAAGVPPAWTSYVKHSDADSVAARVSEAGGQVFMPPMDIMSEGRMMLAADPTGAAFGVWQPGNHKGAQLVNVPNTLVWNELQTRDLPAARKFYHEVFGWSDAEDANQYVTYYQDGRLHCGALSMLGEEWDPNVPANWQVYFLVEDVAATLARVTELGGSVVYGPAPAGGLGELAVLRDPQGAVFSVIRFNGQADPPPGYDSW